MEYFWLRQEHGYLHTPVIKGFHENLRRKDFTVEAALKIPERSIVYCDSEEKQDFIDILDGQLFLVSKAVRHVFQMYEKSITYKFFCFLNNITGEYANYYAPIIPAIDCLAENSFVRKDDVKIKIKIKIKAIGTASIFRVENKEKDMVVVRLDAAESFLRRNLQGIELIRLECI